MSSREASATIPHHFQRQLVHAIQPVLRLSIPIGPHGDRLASDCPVLSPPLLNIACPMGPNCTWFEPWKMPINPSRFKNLSSSRLESNRARLEYRPAGVVQGGDQQQQIQQVLAQHCTGAKGDAYGLSEEKVGSSLFNLSIPRKMRRKKYLVLLQALA